MKPSGTPKSLSALFRRRQKAENPEAYKIYLERQKRINKERRAEKKRKWLEERHTHQMKEDREKERELSRLRTQRFRERKKGVTKTTSQMKRRAKDAKQAVPLYKPKKRPCDMTLEEFREHNRKLKELSRSRQSEQKKLAIKMKNATGQRERRRRAKEALQAKSTVDTSVTPGQKRYREKRKSSTKVSAQRGRQPTEGKSPSCFKVDKQHFNIIPDEANEDTRELKELSRLRQSRKKKTAIKIKIALFPRDKRRARIISQPTSTPDAAVTTVPERYTEKKESNANTSSQRQNQQTGVKPPVNYKRARRRRDTTPDDILEDVRMLKELTRSVQSPQEKTTPKVKKSKNNARETRRGARQATQPTSTFDACDTSDTRNQHTTMKSCGTPKSQSALFRRRQKEENPEAYKIYLERQKLKNKERRAEKKRKWLEERHTRQMKEDHGRERELSRLRAQRYRDKIKGATKSSLQRKDHGATQAAHYRPNKRPRDMTPAEFREHSRKLKELSRSRQSRQKKLAIKVKNAIDQRERRRQAKEASLA